MEIHIAPNKIENGAKASHAGAKLIQEAIAEKGHANIIVATGASQFEMLTVLINEPGIDWTKVTAFHLDEYVGMPITHPASFRKYLKERFVEKLPANLAAFHYVNGDAADPQAECARLGELIEKHPIDVCFAGIGENAHLAFNDPPAQFDAPGAYIVVDLDEACRRQQLGEGWFPSIDDVPKKAISMTIGQILRSQTIIITCPDERKAPAVRDSVEGPVTNLVPSSILQNHDDTRVYLDSASASLLAKN